MTEKIRILFLSANPWTTSRILVDEEEREIFEKLQEGPYRDSFELHKHSAIRSIDLQRLLMMYEPHIVHFSGHASKTQKIILGGTRGRGKEVDRQGLVEVFALYKNHVRLVLLNACFTRTQARSLSGVIDYTVGTGKGLGDKGGVAFAGAFYRALGFGKSVKEAFASAKAELGLTKMPRTTGIELFVRDGIRESDPFPQAGTDLSSEPAAPWRLLSDLFAGHPGDHDILHRAGTFLHETSVLKRTESSKAQIPVTETSNISLSSNLIRYGKESHSCEHLVEHVSGMRRETAAPALGLMARGDKGSSSGLTSLRKARRAKRANSRPGKDEIEPLSSTDYLRACLAVTVKVQRVVLLDGTAVSQTQITRVDQTCRTRASFGDKRLGCDVHRESRRSD
jgi:hypothetical protein